MDEFFALYFIRDCLGKNRVMERGGYGEYDKYRCCFRRIDIEDLEVISEDIWDQKLSSPYQIRLQIEKSTTQLTAQLAAYCS